MGEDLKESALLKYQDTSRKRQTVWATEVDQQEGEREVREGGGHVIRKPVE